MSDFFQQPADLLAHPKNLIDKVDVIDASRYQLVDLCEHGRELTFAVFIAEQRLVTERAGIRTAPGELHFCAQPQVISSIARKDMVHVCVELYRIIGIVQRSDGSHVRGSQSRRSTVFP